MRIAIEGGTPIRNSFIPYGRQYIDESDIEAVSGALRSPYLTTGPMVDLFEEKLCEYTGAKYAVAISNGTSALHAACYAAGIKKGDEVITTPITFAASSNCVLYCGGTPIFADIDSETWNIDPDEIVLKVTKKTKAIIAVDFTGQAARLDEIREICKKHHLILIEDAAHAIGTKYKGIPVGNISDMTTFSFHPVKTITCGEGGAILTNNEAYYNKMKLFRTHSITHEPNYMSKNPYNGYNEQIDLGYNYRMTDIQASLGISQLAKIERFISRRREIVRQYNEAFINMLGLAIQKEISESDTARHLYIIRIKPDMLTVCRNEIFNALMAENIGVQVHYMPVYYHPYYQSLGYKKGLCPKAEKLYEEIITIPLYYSLTDEDVKSVINGIEKVLNHYSKKYA